MLRPDYSLDWKERVLTTLSHLAQEEWRFQNQPKWSCCRQGLFDSLVVARTFLGLGVRSQLWHLAAQFMVGNHPEAGITASCYRLDWAIVILRWCGRISLFFAVSLAKEQKFKTYNHELSFFLKEYRRVTQSVKPIATNLMRPHMENLEFKMRWEGQNRIVLIRFGVRGTWQAGLGDLDLDFDEYRGILGRSLEGAWQVGMRSRNPIEQVWFLDGTKNLNGVNWVEHFEINSCTKYLDMAVWNSLQHLVGV